MIILDVLLVIHSSCCRPSVELPQPPSCLLTGPRGAVGSASDSKARGPRFDTQSGHILPFFLPLIQEGPLSATGESMCTKYC